MFGMPFAHLAADKPQAPEERRTVAAGCRTNAGVYGYRRRLRIRPCQKHTKNAGPGVEPTGGGFCSRLESTFMQSTRVKPLGSRHAAGELAETRYRPSVLKATPDLAAVVGAALKRRQQNGEVLPKSGDLRLRECQHDLIRVSVFFRRVRRQNVQGARNPENRDGGSKTLQKTRDGLDLRGKRTGVRAVEPDRHPLILVVALSTVIAHGNVGAAVIVEIADRQCKMPDF
jgi:hypothetical protein